MIPFLTRVLFLLPFLALAEPGFRTDDSPADTKLPWFQLVEGEFPPEGSAHYFGGELIRNDHVNRKGTLRVDRTDKQRRSHFDLSVDFEMLPYGAIYYHGAPAALVDIPLSTHLHGLFYERAKDSPQPKSIFHNRRSLESNFTRCFRLEDDFSYYQRKGRAWKIESIDKEKSKLITRGVDLDGQNADEKTTDFDLLEMTRIWKGKGFGTKEDLVPGAIVQVNLTWATLYGPGRLTDIWVDEESRSLATKNQMARHHRYQRDHGLAGWIDEVDNQKRILKVTLFGGIDPKLIEDFKKDTSVTCVVAEPTLRSYDQVNDRKSGPFKAKHQFAKEPGSSGVQVEFQTSLLLEGYRPKKIVRVFPSGWPVISIPLEERLWPARD